MKRRILMKRKIKKYEWVILLALSVFAAMYIYGMTKYYFPEPIHLGFGHYIDLATGIVIVGLLLSGLILSILFKKERNVIGTGEYEKIRTGIKKKKPKKKVK